MGFPKNFTDVLRTLTMQNADRLLLLLKYLLKIKIGWSDKFLEAAVRRYFSKQMVSWPTEYMMVLKIWR